MFICELCRRLMVCLQHSSVVGGMVVHNYALVFSHTTVARVLFCSLKLKPYNEWTGWGGIGLKLTIALKLTTAHHTVLL
jgi:hypothetical protein